MAPPPLNTLSPTSLRRVSAFPTPACSQKQRLVTDAMNKVCDCSKKAAAKQAEATHTTRIEAAEAVADKAAAVVNAAPAKEEAAVHISNRGCSTPLQ